MTRHLQPPPAETPEEIRLYPSEDGIPLDSENHRQVMGDLIDAARDWSEERGVPILAGGNLFIYFEEGNPKQCVGPDFFVVRDVSNVPPRRVYKVWSEGKVPELVVELASPSSERKDVGPKRELYERLGVLEYVVFDSEDLGWDPPMVAFRRRGGRLGPEAVWQRDGTVGFFSEVMQLELRPQGDQLRFWDPETGEFVPTRKERADTERERADTERERADTERERADTEHARADAERTRADLERARADRLAAELDRLRAERGDDARE